MRVAENYAPDGSLTINDGPPAVGRVAITAAARSFAVLCSVDLARRQEFHEQLVDLAWFVVTIPNHPLWPWRI